MNALRMAVLMVATACGTVTPAPMDGGMAGTSGMGGTPGTGGMTGTGGAPGTGGTSGGNVDAGRMAFNGCVSCHGTAAEGVSRVGPNISGSAQGIGSWTQAQFNTALRMGLDDTGRRLCNNMPRYMSLTDTQLADLFAFLKTQMSSAMPMLPTGCGT